MLSVCSFSVNYWQIRIAFLK